MSLGPPISAQTCNKFGSNHVLPYNKKKVEQLENQLFLAPPENLSQVISGCPEYLIGKYKESQLPIFPGCRCPGPGSCWLRDSYGGTLESLQPQSLRALASMSTAIQKASRTISFAKTPENTVVPRLPGTLTYGLFYFHQGQSQCSQLMLRTQIVLRPSWSGCVHC